MKKQLLLLAVVVGSALTASAQFEKGTIFLNGGTSLGLNFGTSTSSFSGGGVTIETESSYSSFGLNTMPGYFLMDGLVVGLDINFNTNSSSFDFEVSDTKTVELSYKTSEVLVGPFVRYYLDAGLFFQAGVGFGSASSTDDEYDLLEDNVVSTESSAGAFAYTVGVGYAIFLNDNVALEPSLGYGSVTYSENELPDGIDEITTTDAGLNVGIGISIFFN